MTRQRAASPPATCQGRRLYGARESSKVRSTKLRVVADDVLNFARGGSLPDAEPEELRRAPARYRALFSRTTRH